MNVLQNQMKHKYILDNLANSFTRVISGSTPNTNKCNRVLSNIAILNVNLSLNENVNVNLSDLLKIQYILKVKVSVAMEHIFPAFCDALKYSLRIFIIIS